MESELCLYTGLNAYSMAVNKQTNNYNLYGYKTTK